MAAPHAIHSFRGFCANTSPRMTGAGFVSPDSGTGTSTTSQIRDASRPAGPSRRAAGRPSVALGAPAARVRSVSARARDGLQNRAQQVRLLPPMPTCSPRSCAQSALSHRSVRLMSQNAPDLFALAAAARVAADDALALAARTDHLLHLCAEDAGQCLRGMADATRAHAEDLDRGAVFLARCAGITKLPEMMQDIEAGASYAPIVSTSARSVVVVGSDDPANWPPLARRVAAGLRRRLGRGA